VLSLVVYSLKSVCCDFSIGCDSIYVKFKGECYESKFTTSQSQEENVAEVVDATSSEGIHKFPRSGDAPEV